MILHWLNLNKNMMFPPNSRLATRFDLFMIHISIPRLLLQLKFAFLDDSSSAVTMLIALTSSSSIQMTRGHNFLNAKHGALVSFYQSGSLRHHGYSSSSTSYDNTPPNYNTKDLILL